MILEATWFFLWGLLWAIYFMTDGFDLGVGTLLPFLGRTEGDKNTMLASIGPLWDGNEVWLITAGGVTFAAFPMVYAVMFSSLYTPLMLILFALIFRGVSFEFRSHIASPAWRKFWNGCIFIGSVLPAVLFGVAFANIFQGIPISREGIFQGNLFTLLNPYGLLGGVLFLLFFLVHGALWLSVKTEGDLRERAAKTAKTLWIPLAAAAVVFLISSRFATPLYENYLAHPVLLVFILATVAALFAIRLFLAQNAFGKAWLASAATIAGATFYGIIGLYPDMFPSSINAAYSLTAHNSASSPLTLKIMLLVTLIFIPIVVAYQGWTYHLFKGKVTDTEAGY